MLSDPFGSTLAICLMTVRIQAGFSTTAQAGRMRPGLRGSSFVLDGKRVSIDAETEIELGFRLADRTSSVLVW
jgi:hypothetical protein